MGCSRRRSLLWQGLLQGRSLGRLHCPLDRYILSFCVVIVISSFSLAKSLVAAGLARRILVQLSYAIGVAEPLSIYVDSYGTGKKSDEELVKIIRNNWDLRPGVIGKGLTKPLQPSLLILLVSP